jgi:hypothetical protein
VRQLRALRKAVGLSMWGRSRSSPCLTEKKSDGLTYALDRASRAAVPDWLFDPSISSEENEADERQAASCRASPYGQLRTAIGRLFCINYLITDINALISAER